MTIEDKQITIEELISLCKNYQLHKPEFQRDKQWKDCQNFSFLNFTFSMQHILSPFLCTKTLVQNPDTFEAKEVYSVFDGNNRLNALFDFEKNPLKYLPSISANAKSFFALKPGGDEVFQLISNLSYSDIYNITSLREICNKDEKMFNWYRANDDREGSVETTYHELHTSIVKLKFTQIKLSLKVFSNLGVDKIVEIFTNINTSGVQLSTQDILKATCSLTTFESHEINEFAKLLQLTRDYIEEQNRKELLSAPLPERRLSTFQVLFATQLLLHQQFPLVVDAPGAADMDIVFKLYQSFYPMMNVKNAANINIFIENLLNCTKILQKVQHILFGIVFVERGLPLIPRGLNKITVLIFHMMKNEWNFKALVKVVLYNRLCSLLSRNDTEGKELFELQNSLRYETGGKTMSNFINMINRSEPIGKIPSRETMKSLFLHLIRLSQKPCEFHQKRTQYNPIVLEVIMNNLYYYSRIPVSFHETPLHLDHIVPSGLNGWSGPLDLNRVGNRMLIPKVANLKKSNRQVTTDFLQKNKISFEYFNYITADEYNQIVQPGDIVNHEEFEKFCLKREQNYLQGILDYLYLPTDDPNQRF